MKNCTKIEGQIFLSHICKKCDSYWQKTCSWCLWNFKFGTQANYLMLRKKSQNNFFHRGQEHCENGIWNIQIFVYFFSSSKNIWCGILRLVFNWSLHAYVLPLTLTSIACSSHLVHKYILKEKLKKYPQPNILSEIMRFQEHGSRGKHFCCFF